MVTREYLRYMYSQKVQETILGDNAGYCPPPIHLFIHTSILGNAITFADT